MRDEDFIAVMTVGIILTLWFVGGLIAVGRPRTYRLGLWVLGSGVVVGFIAGFAWVS